MFGKFPVDSLVYHRYGGGISIARERVGLREVIDVGRSRNLSEIEIDDLARGNPLWGTTGRAVGG
jgi:hypothetical protein